MADKLNKVDKEESISRVYQFLNKQKDWQATADRNNDGTIIKNEFRAFILSSNFKFNAGEDKNDLIDKFWSSIDSNSSGKISGGSGLSNKNALDGKEIEHINNSIEATGKVISYVNDKLQFPSGLDSSYQAKWKNSVKQGMINRAAEFLKSATLDELTDEKLAEFARMSSVKATADYKAAEGAEELSKQYGDIGYKAGDDEVRKDIVDEYISGLTGEESDEDIIADVEKIMNAYIDTAKTNSADSVNLLAKYGYDASADLNPLQLAVLNKDMTDKILAYVKQSNPEIYTEEYEEQIRAVVEEFVTEYLSDKSADEFTSLKNFNVSEFVSSETYKTLVADIKEQLKEVIDARQKLDTYIGELLAKNDEEINAIVKDVIGSTDAVEIANILLSLKTVAAINAKYDELESRIQGLGSTRAAQEQLKQAAYAASFGELASLIDDIQIDKLSVMTCGKAAIHTEFGVDARGDIVFEQPETTDVYDKVKTTLKQELKQNNKEAFEAIGSSNIDKLIQAAWIMSYNRFDSSDSHSTSAFITEVLNNFKTILDTLTNHTEYLSLYTGHTAYANSKLTSGLLHYGTKTTYGNDAIWNYSGNPSVASDGSVAGWESQVDAEEYKVVMNQLLVKIKKTEPYKDIDSSIIETVFREAQEKAIIACQQNKNDLPYGTTNMFDYGYVGFGTRFINQDTASPIAQENTDWAGKNRNGDKSDITPKTLVELTLYYFDKLLYSKLAE